MNASSLRIGFLGLGLMGSGMARRLVGAGFPVAVFNRNPDKAKPLAEAGARVAKSPRDAAAEADVVVSMVADDNAARAVWLGADGALAGMKRGAVVVESSTVTVGWVRELAAATTAHGCEFLDAPVTGSRMQAAAGELNFLVGGAAATLERVRPVLTPMSKTINPLGPVGSGAMMKLINNFLCGVQIASLAEAVAMIERSGLDRAKAVEMLTSGAPGSPLVKTISGRMLASDFTPNFALRLLAKDLGYAVEEARGQQLDLTTAANALALFRKAIDAQLGDRDMSSLVEVFRKK
jgi:3-hydroxyisobutyrate dehydrogenase